MKRLLARTARALAAAAALVLASAAPAQTQAVPAPSVAARKVALVIGNARYAKLPLRTAVNDARQVAATLRELGFEVAYKENADWDAMVESLAAFSMAAQGSQVRLFYYAGHGMQVRSRNYLHPIGTMPASEHELRARSIDLDEFVDRLGQASQGVSVVVVDACRRNPFSELSRSSRGGGSQGMAARHAPSGMLLAFSTSPNGVAQDSIDGTHSPYTRRLLDELRTPGLPVELLFKRVHTAVAADTQRGQRPWLSSSLSGEFCLRPQRDGRCGDLK